jgi:DtxR family Mn-dependent transcriptional regulator
MARRQSASMEDYLEAVEVLDAGEGPVRAKEISAMLGVKMPSVTAAMKRLSEDKLVVYERYGRIRLTSAGRKAARNVCRRHQVLCRFLVDILGMDPESANRDACRMEHSISPAALERMDRFLEFSRRAEGRKAKERVYAGGEPGDSGRDG